jgi:hypothetical protein
MASFKHTRWLLLESFDEGVIDEDEFLLLYEQYFSKNQEFSYKHVGELTSMRWMTLNAWLNFDAGKAI